MPALTFRTLAMAALMLGFVSTDAGCYVEEAPPPVYADGYEPQFYNGYVVYYDDVGRPYYHVDGAVVWVPVASPLYIGLVNHWHVYRPAYGRWYGHYGYRYHGYHRR